ncbi:hypothetical protein L5515_002780 [Caenorhabditis briggsae]|uniref:F-box domain-containing protein n=1 Tax=Caenorhabditis briggsae TaxID=6238 RepID=A0AAE9E9K1_CAEBR|nr:hypothetical protein L5515_002780 [Caenorhabditis briggsae]
MKILKFPDSVQHLIFEAMQAHELFFMSICSKNSKSTIRKWKNRFKAIRFSSETYFTGFLAISCYGSFKDEQFVNAVEWKITGNSNRNGAGPGDSKLTKMEFEDGMVLKFRLKIHHKPDKPPILCIEGNDDYSSKLAPVQFFNYVKDLFQITQIKELRLRRTDFSDFPKDLKSVKNAIIDTYCQYVNPKVFERFFSKIHVENCFISEQSVRGPMQENTPIMRIPNVFLENATWLLPYHLYNFQGKNAVFENSKFIKNSNLLRFLELWITGNLDTIDTVILSTTENTWGFSEVLNGIDTFQWDSNRRAKTFVYKAAFRRFFQKDFNFFDCSEGSDIKKSTDGTLATIRLLSETRSGISKFYFVFFVWHDTFPSPENYQNEEPNYQFV